MNKTKGEGSSKSLPNIIENDSKKCQHEWVVFSTALAEGWLMLQCVRCGTHGTVDAPTAEEWSEAFHAPSKPYQWNDETRVTIHGEGAVCVLPKQDGKPCECIERGIVISPDRFERIPGGIMVPEMELSKFEKRDFIELASTVLDGGLCSRLLAFFIECCHRDTGIKPSDTAENLSQLLERWDSKGLHMSPGVVARILRSWAS